MMWWDGGYGMGAAGVIWIVVMLAMLALIVVGIILVVRGLSSRRGHGDPGYSLGPPSAGARPGGALQVLEERYARGEIDREEFLRRKADLTS